jgi:hypothetical protein
VLGVISISSGTQMKVVTDEVVVDGMIFLIVLLKIAT